METSAFSQFNKPTTAQRYALAVVSAAVALVLREVFSGWFGTTNPYHTVWAAVVFSAWYCGVGPAVVTTILSLIGVWYFFIPPQHSFRLEDPKTAITGLVGFAVLSGFIIAIGEATRRLRQSLVEAREELEQRVRERTAQLEQKTAELTQKAALLDLANDAILVRDAEGRISYWNEGAERLYGWKRADILGRSTSEFLRTEFTLSLSDILQSDRWEGEFRQYTRDGSPITVSSRWTTLRNDDGKPIAWLEINTDITALKNTEKAARKLSGRILTLQDRERRRIARGLHDSLGQYLTALKMSLDFLSTSNGNQSAVILECSNIVEKCLTETRTISHLLHPPLLDEAGLQSAIQWYVDGFGSRSGVIVSVDLPKALDRFQTEVETTLFRVVQEGLTNVHRHSHASEATIRLIVDTKNVQLEVKDNGRGMPKDRLRSVLESGGDTGVGLAGMRERVRDLGGSLTIESSQAGTLLSVSIPIAKAIRQTQTESVSAA